MSQFQDSEGKNRSALNLVQRKLSDLTGCQHLLILFFLRETRGSFAQEASAVNPTNNAITRRHLPPLLLIML